MSNCETAINEAEVQKCAENFVYFCENYLKVNHPKLGLVPFKLHEYQKRYAKHLEENKHSITKKFRQGGFTTTTLAWLTWIYLFKSNQKILVVSKYDREAIYCSSVVRKFLQFLPAELRGEITKENDHGIDNAKDNRFNFRSCQACCGQSADYLFIDEAAFINDMEEHWKALYPLVSNGGKAIVVSTVNGAKGWFYETYVKASRNNNEFKVFQSRYDEHPEYANQAWVDEVKKNLGEMGWRQEVLCEFWDKERRTVFSKDPTMDITRNEEKRLLKKARPLTSKQLTDCKDFNGPFKLIGENDPKFTEDFEYPLRPKNFRSYHWSDVSEDMAVEQEEITGDSSLSECIDLKRKNLKELEDRINEVGYSQDHLILAGVLGENEKYEPTTDGPVVCEQMLETIRKGNLYSDNIEFKFEKKRLCLNGIPTKIKEYDLCCLYNGLLPFIGHEKSLKKISKMIGKKIEPIFGIEGEEKE
jgi:hypothetical protein